MCQTRYSYFISSFPRRSVSRGVFATECGIEYGLTEYMHTFDISHLGRRLGGTKICHKVREVALFYIYWSYIPRKQTYLHTTIFPLTQTSLLTQLKITYDNTGSDRKINSFLFMVKSNKKTVFLNFIFCLYCE
jgi:hypothetical protein